MALQGVGLGSGRLTGCLIAATCRALHQLVGVLVERDHIGAAAVHLEGVATRAAAQVEHPLPRLEAEAVEVNGQHSCLLAARCRMERFAGPRSRPRTPRQLPPRRPAS